MDGLLESGVYRLVDYLNVGLYVSGLLERGLQLLENGVRVVWIT